MEVGEVLCLVVDGVKNPGGMPNPVTRSHPIGNPDADHPCTDVVISREFVKIGSVYGGSVVLGGCGTWGHFFRSAE